MSGTDWSRASLRRRSDHAAIDGSWVPGLILITLGAIFLAQTWFDATLHNWWALFFLIPAVSTLTTAYALSRDGRPSAAGGPLIAGLGFVALAAAFVLDLPIGQLWPVALIIVGVGLLVSRGRG